MCKENNLLVCFVIENVGFKVQLAPLAEKLNMAALLPKRRIRTSYL